MQTGRSPVLVFTDLDGSLLDQDYSCVHAAPALRRIQKERIPLIFTTSKTRSEVERLQQELGIQGPFIVENGGAIFFPLGDGETAGPAERPSYLVITLGKPYRTIRAFVQKIRSQVPLTGFGDLSAEGVSTITGLPVEKALLAKQREFTEPVLLDDPGQLPLLRELAWNEGLNVVKGGRFHHLMMFGQDKGKAVERVLMLYSEEGCRPPLTVGLGDSANDLPMLHRVDIPVLIPPQDGSMEDPEIPGLLRPRFPGSRGWKEGLEAALQCAGVT
jgi:mannosyl-3-phosphoglycerate phosphatase